LNFGLFYNFWSVVACSVAFCLPHEKPLGMRGAVMADTLGEAWR
jgi:hypothetical protein